MNHKGLILSVLLLFNTAMAEVTISDLIQNQDQFKFLNPKVEVVKEKDNHYYLKISQDTKQISRRSISESSSLYKELGIAKSYVLARHYLIPLSIQSRVSGIDLSYEKSIATDVDVKTNSFSNIRGRKIADLFGHYQGFTMNAGVVLLGGGYTRLKNSTGIVLSEINAVTPPPAPLIGVNVGVTAAKAYVSFSPLSDGVNIQFEMRTIKDGEGLLDVEKATRSMNLQDLIDREL